MTQTATTSTEPPGGGPVRQSRVFFARHWQRGAPGTPTPDWVVTLAYRMWLVALLCKLLGSSWDMSWHFRWLRDDLAPPHLLNSIGTVTVCVLVLIHTYTGMGCDKRSLRLMQAGTAVFLIAAPLDVINHRVSGLDLTAWSGTHLLLYLGTAIMIAGAIDGRLKHGKPGRARTMTLGALWVFFLENAFFPNGQQEYGILSLRAWQNGSPDAEPELLGFAAEQLNRPVDAFAVQRFALPIDDWVYPLWGIGVMALILVAARVTARLRWTATVVAGVYVVYRAVIWPLLVAGGFPPSTVPFYLLFVGLAVDLAFRFGRTRVTTAVVAGAAVTTLGFGALYLQSQLAGWLELAGTQTAPPVNYWMAPVVFALVAVTVAAVTCVELCGRCWLAVLRELHSGRVVRRLGRRCVICCG
ncbi:MAG: hypothetical protein ACRDQB_08280, partial [Thermocrispum sp.]